MEGQPAYARISASELTRLKIVDGRIENVRGIQGEMMIEPDANTGEAYLRPTSPNKLVSLFVTSNSGITYTLILSPEAIPATNIIIKELSKPSAASTQSAGPGHERTIMNLILAMEREDEPQGVDVQKVGERVPLWKGVNFILEKKYVGPELVGETYKLTNQNVGTMVIAEPEFFKDGVEAVSINDMQVPDDASTHVFIVRRRANNE
ncbi:MAG: TraK domain-containing protein [Sulfuricaulis sp.]